MNTSQISGDSKVVFGVPMPKDKGIIDIPPKKDYKKAIEEGEIALNFEPNTKVLIDKLEAQKGRDI